MDCGQELRTAHRFIIAKLKGNKIDNLKIVNYDLHDLSIWINGTLHVTYTTADDGRIYCYVDDISTSPIVPKTLCLFFDQTNGNILGYADNKKEVEAFKWDFGDGESSTEANPTHVFAETGNFNVRLELFLKNGRQKTISPKKIKIIESPKKPNIISE